MFYGIMAAIGQAGRTGKEKIAESVIKKLLNSEVERYGYMLNLNIDSAAKQITAEILPAGEQTPITITAHYKFTHKQGEAQIKLSNIQTSREWITVLITELMQGQHSMPLPPAAGRIAATLL